MKMSLWKNTVLLMAMTAAFGFLLAWRYAELKIEVNQANFFNQAGWILSLAQRSTLEPSAHPAENLILPLQQQFAEINQPALMNPFYPDRMLSLRYGRVDSHFFRPSTRQKTDKPLWFIIADGPAQNHLHPTIVSQDENRIRYTLVTGPYNPTNGLWSLGYLYADSQGRRLGF